MSLRGGGGPAGAQELGCFCNRARLQPAAEEVKLWARGWNVEGQEAGGAAVSPLLAAWRALAVPFGEGGAPHSKVHGWGGPGPGGG